MKRLTGNQIEKFLKKHGIDYNCRVAATNSRYYELHMDRGDILIDDMDDPGAYDSEIFVLRMSNHEGYDGNGHTSPNWNVCPEDMSWEDAKKAILEMLKEWPGAVA